MPPPADLPWSRRRFLAGSGVVAGGLALGLDACSDDSGSTAKHKGSGTTVTGGGSPDPATGIVDADVPGTDEIFGWIEEVFSHGIRRPGYPADIWAEGWTADRFAEIGLEHVRLEPVDAVRWKPVEWSAHVTSASGTKDLTGFPVPFAAPASGLEVELVEFDDAAPAAVSGRAAMVDVQLLKIPPTLLAGSGSAPADTTDRVFDPDGTFTGASQTVPFGSGFQAVMEPAIDAGAAAFVGTLTGYPGDSCNYFVPYDGIDRPIPGIWLSGTDGAWLRGELRAGPVRIRLDIATETEKLRTHNVVGELAGATDEVVMVGSHHDGPWSSAVEDGSGISMVLAQATYWAAQPEARRPHRMVFLLQGGHMSGGAGLLTYIRDHRDELADVVLEVHLEHAALEGREVDGKVVPTDQPTPRWFFTSRIPQLEASVAAAIRGEELWRSLIAAPDAFGTQPPTDGAFYHREGVPIVNLLAAPFYLFDEMDTLDKIDKAHLVPITRTVIRIIESTRGETAAGLRAAVQ